MIARVLGNSRRNRSVDFFLYGSRADDRLRGGDIDLVGIGASADIATLQTERIEILARLERALGERRIDLSFVTREQAAADAFWRRALVGAVRLG